MTDNTTDGGTVRYHRAERASDGLWAVWFAENGACRWLSPEEGEAMGLTPPPPPEPDWDTLPVGSVVKSKHGNLWHHLHDGWAFLHPGLRYPTPPAMYAPYTVTHRHEPEVTLEAALRAIGCSDHLTSVFGDDDTNGDKYLRQVIVDKVIAAARQVVAEWDAR